MYGYGGGWSIEDDWYFYNKDSKFKSATESELVYAGLMYLYGMKEFATKELFRIAEIVTEAHEQGYTIADGEKIEIQTEATETPCTVSETAKPDRRSTSAERDQDGWN